MASSIGPADIAILIAYGFAVLAIGIYNGRKTVSADQFYLGNKQIPWWAIGLSVIASYISALSFLGAPAWAYTSGFSVIALNLAYPIAIYIVITFLLPVFFRSGSASIYEFLETRFGATTRSVNAALFLLTQLLTTAAVIYATGLIIQFITGFDIMMSILLITVISFMATVKGGATAVIWTDVMQGLVLLLGAALILVCAIFTLPAPLAEVLAGLKAQGKLDPLDWSVDLTLERGAWAGTVAMSLYLTSVYGTTQTMVQRALASKTLLDAKKSYLMMGYTAFPLYFVFTLSGVLFYAHYAGRSFENPNTIVLGFIADLGVPGLSGLLTAAVLAASFSSIEAALNSMATISTVDFYERYFAPGRDQRHYLTVSRRFLAVAAALVIFPAIAYSTTTGSILAVLGMVGSYLVGIQLAMFLVGMFAPRVGEKSLLIGMAIGFSAVFAVASMTSIAWPWYCVVGAMVNFAAAWLLSFLPGWETAKAVPRSTVSVDALEGGGPTKGIGLLLFFVATIACLYALYAMI